MARTPMGTTARTEHISLRATKSTAAALDRQRGTLSRSAYITRLIVRDSQPRKDEK